MNAMREHIIEGLIEVWGDCDQLLDELARTRKDNIMWQDVALQYQTQLLEAKAEIARLKVEAQNRAYQGPYN
jgi:hypothetical protein